MIRTEDLIKHSGIIEYLEEYRKELQLDYDMKQDETDKFYFDLYAIGVVDYLLEHFKELSEDEK